ncbi:MAG TPA: hypothetical protein VM434_20540, partial [Beijerinckiaceae bacterium]|nr:hypothetical protein [Beijerinckiaceae bacterium]
RTLGPIAPGPVWRWHRGSVDVEISGGGLASVGDAAALAGENAFAVRGPDGRWEILCAAQAELIGPRTYRLSRLLRGLGGSEAEAARSVPAGALAVRLDPALVPLTDAVADLGVPWLYRVAPTERDHADPSAVAFTATAGADALRPLAPVHVRARREPGGIRIRWIRRTRRDGDAWEPAEVPLGESLEAYALDVLQGATTLRSFVVGVPECLYPAADELADFGAPQADLAVRVAQTNAFGRGFETTVTVPVA